MPDVKDMTKDEIKKAWEDREKLEQSDIPEPAANPDLTEVRRLVRKMMESAEKGTFIEDVHRQAIYSFLVEAFYPEENGEAVWRWIRTKMEGHTAALPHVVNPPKHAPPASAEFILDGLNPKQKK